MHDDPEEINKSIEFMKNELTSKDIDFNIIKSSWKKTLVERRTFIQNHTTKEVLIEYPGYSNTSLVRAYLLFGFILEFIFISFELLW